MKISECMVQNKETCDEILHRKSFDVNMRLYKGNKNYQSLIHGIVEYLLNCLETHFEDYAVVKGISGANVGIPLNIIAIRNGDKVIPMLNPKLLRCSRVTRKMASNCGSLNLKVCVEIERPKWITYSYYNISGERFTVEKIEIADGAATILHEIEHNLGILIIDKLIKKGKRP